MSFSSVHLKPFTNLKTYFEEELAAITMEWFSHDLECQEFHFGNMTLQKLEIICDFGCSVYQILPEDSE